MDCLVEVKKNAIERIKLWEQMKADVAKGDYSKFMEIDKRTGLSHPAVALDRYGSSGKYVTGFHGERPSQIPGTGSGEYKIYSGGPKVVGGYGRMDLEQIQKYLENAKNNWKPEAFKMTFGSIESYDQMVQDLEFIKNFEKMHPFQARSGTNLPTSAFTDEALYREYFNAKVRLTEMLQKDQSYLYKTGSIRPTSMRVSHEVMQGDAGDAVHDNLKGISMYIDDQPLVIMETIPGGRPSIQPLEFGALNSSASSRGLLAVEKENLIVPIHRGVQHLGTMSAEGLPTRLDYYQPNGYILNNVYNRAGGITFAGPSTKIHKKGGKLNKKYFYESYT